MTSQRQLAALAGVQEGRYRAYLRGSGSLSLCEEKAIKFTKLELAYSTELLAWLTDCPDDARAVCKKYKQKIQNEDTM